MSERPLLAIDGLDVRLQAERRRMHVLRNVSLEIGSNKVVGLVGESGSGKSTLALAILGMLPDTAMVSARRFRFDAIDSSRYERLEGERGRGLAMVFQDPMSALNPLFSVGSLMVEAQRAKHPDLGSSELWARAEAMLARVGVPDARQRMRLYPHAFSGGMRQRVMIAMAFLVEPKLLLADEPTTALDATIEAQIIALLRELREQTRCSVLLVSHSLGLVAELCEEVLVMYAGEIVERGRAEDVLAHPLHPYTRALLTCEIDPAEPVTRDTPLRTIAGSVPDLAAPPQGCIFAARCPLRHERCDTAPPVVVRGGGQSAACWLA
jgi:peptide/nickel transport system ATP-binding protein